MLNNSRKFIFMMIFLLLGISVGWRQTQASSTSPAALIRIEVQTENQLQRFAELGVLVYARLWGSAGEELLLAEGDHAQIARLNQAGFTVRILDPDSTGAAYFLVGRSTEQPVFPELSGITLLDALGDVFVVRTQSIEAIESLPQRGVPIKRLYLHPLVVSFEDVDLDGLAAFTADPVITQMIDQVDAGTAHGYVGDLSGEWSVQVNDNPYIFATRYSRAEIPIKKATKFVQEHFLGLGLTAYFSTFLIDSETVELRNVIANQPGVTDPDCIVMLVGHLDDTSQIPHSLAPGADDNASGIAGVLAGADILSQFKFACTIRYAAFTGEEQGLLGSRDYASEVYAAGENVVAVVNLDMIAYNSDVYEIIELHTRPGNTGDLAIANLFKNVVQAYDINLTPNIEQDALSFSDHSSFWDYGYSAILGIEDFDDFTPYYHTTGDRLSTLDSVYLADFIRAAVGTVAHLAVPVQFEDMYLPMIFK